MERTLSVQGSGRVLSNAVEGYRKQSTDIHCGQFSDDVSLSTRHRSDTATFRSTAHLKRPPPHQEVSWSSRITYTFTCFGPMDVRRRHSTSVAIWPPLMDAHACNFFILLLHLCVSCAVPLPVVSSFTVICDVIFPIWNTLGILWCPFLMLVINSFDAHIHVSFSSFKERRDKVWFILQWSRNLYSVDADTGDSALQMHIIQSMNLSLFKGMHCYYELHVQGSPTDIYNFEVLWEGYHLIHFFLCCF